MGGPFLAAVFVGIGYLWGRIDERDAQKARERRREHFVARVMAGIRQDEAEQDRAAIERLIEETR